MLSLPPTVRIWLATQPADLRKSFDSLAALVRDGLRGRVPGRQDDLLAGRQIEWLFMEDAIVPEHADGVPAGSQVADERTFLEILDAIFGVVHGHVHTGHHDMYDGTARSRAGMRGDLPEDHTSDEERTDRPGCGMQQGSKKHIIPQE